MISKILLLIALLTFAHGVPSMQDPHLPNLNTTVNYNITQKNSFITPYAKARDLFWGGQTDLMLFFVTEKPDAVLMEVFEESARLLQGFTKASLIEFKGNCDMITCGFELENSSFPLVGFAHMSKWNTVIHYKMELPLKPENVWAHYEESIVKKNKSDSIPQTLTAEEKALFKEVFADTVSSVMDGKEDLIIFYMAPWCDYCEATKARLLHGIREAGVFGKVALYEADAYTNPVNEVNFQGWPILKLYLKNDRANPITLDGFSEANMKKTLKDYLGK